MLQYSTIATFYEERLLFFSPQFGRRQYRQKNVKNYILR